MKILGYNLNKPNVNVIYNIKKQTRWEKVSRATQGMKMG
jgi:hypothetical protein